jgi:hypothetical protein
MRCQAPIAGVPATGARHLGCRRPLLGSRVVAEWRGVARKHGKQARIGAGGVTRPA